MGTERRHQELPAHVVETVHTNVIEHVHPVVYKEVLKPRVVEETQQTYETVKERPITTYEVREMRHDNRPRKIMTERQFFEEFSHEGEHNIPYDRYRAPEVVRHHQVVDERHVHDTYPHEYVKEHHSKKHKKDSGMVYKDVTPKDVTVCPCCAHHMGSVAYASASPHEVKLSKKEKRQLRHESVA